ncbi:UrcA family protein [Qipengyuania sp. DSG2-2]|uniref:UrcA family protein n=1 Tax=Qipengyuania sp. DGS2-2 TaxID=3349631 RepID=UPI0036D21B33
MKTVFVTIAAAAAVLAAPASAGSPAPAGSIVVQHADLNLATVEGQKTLDRRINAAARKVCQFSSAPANGALATAEARRCVSKARASAAQAFALAVEQDQRTG